MVVMRGCLHVTPVVPPHQTIVAPAVAAGPGGLAPAAGLALVALVITLNKLEYILF